MKKLLRAEGVILLLIVVFACWHFGANPGIALSVASLLIVIFVDWLYLIIAINVMAYRSQKRKMPSANEEVA